MEMLLLRAAVSPRPPLFQAIPVPAPSFSYSRVPPGCRPNAVVFRRGLGCPACCSFSQVHGYGTVDYEQGQAPNRSSLYFRISTLKDTDLSVGDVLDRWEAEERRLTKWVLWRVVKELRKFWRPKHALEVYNWMAKQKDRFPFKSSDMAIQLDLIAKVYGISQAEQFFLNLPDTLKCKQTYGALLNCYGQAKMKDKAQNIFETIRNKGYATEALPFNVMMTLYMNVGEHEKVNMIVNEMKDSNVTFDACSYNIRISNCAAMQDAEELERVAEEIRSDRNVNENWNTFTTLAAMYARLGNFEKAESCLNLAKLRITGRNPAAFNFLIQLYGKIGKREEVYQLWNRYISSFHRILNSGYVSMLLSLTKMGDRDGAKVIYEEWLSSTLYYDPKVCNILIYSYASEGLAAEAKDVLDAFVEKGGKPSAVTWDLLAGGYINQKQLSEALLCVKEAASCDQGNKWRPKLRTIENLQELCREKKDVDSLNMLTALLSESGGFLHVPHDNS